MGHRHFSVSVSIFQDDEIKVLKYLREWTLAESGKIRINERRPRDEWKQQPTWVCTMADSSFLMFVWPIKRIFTLLSAVRKPVPIYAKYTSIENTSRHAVWFASSCEQLNRHCMCHSHVCHKGGSMKICLGNNVVVKLSFYCNWIVVPAVVYMLISREREYMGQSVSHIAVELFCMEFFNNAKWWNHNDDGKTTICKQFFYFLYSSLVRLGLK